MTTDVERPLIRVQTGDDLETRLVDGTFRLLGILQSNANLIAQLGMFVGLEILYRLGKVVLDEVEEGAVVLLLHPRVMYDECTVCNDRSGRLSEKGLNDYGRVYYGRAELTLSHSARAPGPPGRKISMSIIGSVAVESDIPSGAFKNHPNQERGWWAAQRAFDSRPIHPLRPLPPPPTHDDQGTSAHICHPMQN